MPLLVPPAVIRTLSKRSLRSLVWWNDRFHLLGRYPVVKRLGSISTVSDQPLESEPFDKRDGCRQVRCLSRGQRQAQRVAQTVDRDMDFGAEATATTPQRLRFLAARFFGRRRRKDVRGRWWNQLSRSPYLDHRRSAGASGPKHLGHTSGRTACTPCSISRIRLVKAAIGHRSGLPRARLQRNGGSRPRCRHKRVGRFLKTPAFLSIVHH